MVGWLVNSAGKCFNLETISNYEVRKKPKYFEKPPTPCLANSVMYSVPRRDLNPGSLTVAAPNE